MTLNSFFRFFVVVAVALCVVQNVSATDISTTGTGKVMVVTDLTKATIGVSHEEIVVDDEGNYTDVELSTVPPRLMQKVADSTFEIVSYLSSLKGEEGEDEEESTNIIKTLKTSQIKMENIYRTIRDLPPQLIGYRVKNFITFTAANDETGAVLDEVVSLGANRIEEVSFIASEENMQEARLEAHKKATLNAIDTLDVVINTIGEKRKEIMRASIGSYREPPIRRYSSFRSSPMMMEALDAGNHSSTPIEGGEMEVVATVTVTVRY